MTTETLFTPTQTAAEAPESAAERPSAAPSPDDPLAWLPYGQNLSDHVQTEMDRGGNSVLRLALRGSRPALRDADAARAEAENRVRERALDLVQATDAYRRLAEVRPQYRAALAAKEDAEKKAQAAARKRADLERMTPAPAGLASRLVKAQADADQADAEHKAKSAELEAIKPLYGRACGEVRASLPALQRKAYDEVYAERQEAALARLRSVAEGCKDDLTQLYLLRRGAASMSIDTRAEALARLIIDNPDAPE